MRVTTIDPISDARWDAFVSSHPDGLIYHRSAWSRVLRESYGFEPRYYIAEDRGQLVGAAPFYLVQSWLTGTRLVCLPFSDRCAPLAQSVEVSRLLLKTILDDAGETSVELRGWGSDWPPEEAEFVDHSRFSSHLAKLDATPARLWEKLAPLARRNVRLAEKRGVTVRPARGEADLARFYQLNVATRQKLGVLPQPFRFFRAIQRHILESKQGLLLLAEDERQEVVAGVLYLMAGKTITYKFNASDPSSLHLRPNNLLIWKGMEWACQQGYEWLDFGRSSLGAEGLRSYKAQWATEEIPLPYYYHPESGGASALDEKSLKYRVMGTAVRHMPSFALKLVGTCLYSHAG